MFRDRRGRSSLFYWNSQIEIIEIAEQIDTFNLSILPFEDCCTVFAPKAPKTNPKLEKCLFYEEKFDVEGLVQRAVDGIMITRGMHASSL